MKVHLILQVTVKICDVLIGPSAFRYDRFQVMDFLHPWVTEPIQLLIPMPAFVSNSLAFVEPFTFQVSDEYSLITCLSKLLLICAHMYYRRFG